MKLQVVAWILFVNIVQISTKDLPKEFKKCQRGAALNACLLEAANLAIPLLKNGNKEFNLLALDPFLVGHILYKADEKKAINVRREYFNFKIDNFSKTTITKLNLDFDAKTLDLVAINSLTNFDADCDLRGKVLLLPIRGKGRMHIDMKNLTISLRMTFEQIEKDGETYLNFKIKTSHIKPNDFYIHFDNLFNGDKTLTDAMNDVINENWPALFEEEEPQFTKILNVLYLKYINTFFGQVPLSKLFD